MKFVRTCEKGVTLLELLLALTILSIVLLSFTRFFFQAGTYNQSNQSKTVATNVARNVLMYMEKQPFIKVRHDFGPALLDTKKRNDYAYELYLCGSGYQYFEPNKPKNAGCKPISINNESYHVKIYPEKMDEPEKRKYYIPITVEVSWGADDKKTTALDGTIKSEDLR
ncbi:prepilin-type N-terminal cleavage/methylation domain-containing protein [Bacillus xiapuensis]|uniref:prepilin-type N-terminal cleavage/methylation domain-containing protein n=1 Tax=Bacillus xiapuensis TaxID=2014075 RepID=UPI0012FD8E13|nr:prepilin-type N-terminal cleavage/methylation domain-containing protein [Bacillus xiapuensis]